MEKLGLQCELQFSKQKIKHKNLSISNINVYHASSYHNHICTIPLYNIALKDGICIFPNCFQIFQIQALNANIQTLLPCKIKVLLHVKGATKTAYGNSGFCKLETRFLSSLYPNLMMPFSQFL